MKAINLPLNQSSAYVNTTDFHLNQSLTFNHDAKSSGIVVASGGSFSVDLNGKSITNNSTGLTVNVSGNKSQLTLTDLKYLAGTTSTPGTITGKKGIVVEKEGKLILAAGQITGFGDNEGTTYGGGVAVVGGAFTMSGGTIAGNKATDGAAVFISKDDKGNLGSFTFSGGSISGNEASGEYGCNVLVESGTFTIAGADDETNGSIGSVSLGEDCVITLGMTPSWAKASRFLS